MKLCGAPCPQAPDLLPCQLPKGHKEKWHQNRSSSWPVRRYAVQFTPVGWHVIDTYQARDPLQQFGLGKDEYKRAHNCAQNLNMR